MAKFMKAPTRITTEIKEKSKREFEKSNNLNLNNFRHLVVQ